MYSLDDLYQCTLQEYCDHIGTTPAKLIERKYKEIDLLQRAYDKLIAKRMDMSIALMAKAINEKIHSKRKSIARYEKWLSKGE